MAEEEEGRSKTSGPIGAGAFLLLPLIYFLALGPAVKAYPHVGQHGQRLLEGIYTPLEWLTRELPLLDDLVKLYLGLWA